MILPLLIGYVIAGKIRNSRIEVTLSLAIGAVLGILAGVFQIGLMYPFFIMEFEEVLIPETKVYSLFFLTPSIRVLIEGVWLGPSGWPLPVFLISVLTFIGAVSGLIGVLVGTRVKEFKNT